MRRTTTQTKHLLPTAIASNARVAHGMRNEPLSTPVMPMAAFSARAMQVRDVSVGVASKPGKTVSVVSNIRDSAPGRCSGRSNVDDGT